MRIKQILNFMVPNHENSLGHSAKDESRKRKKNIVICMQLAQFLGFYNSFRDNEQDAKQSAELNGGQNA